MGQASVFTFTENNETVTKTKLNNLVANLLSEFNGSIDNSNIDSGAAIIGSKLDLSSPGIIGGTSASAGTFTTLIGSTIDGPLGSNTPAAIIGTNITGTGTATFNDDSNATVLLVDNGGTGHGEYITQSAILAGGKHMLYVHALNGANQTNADAALVKIFHDDNGSTEPTLETVNEGQGSGVLHTQSGILGASQHALEVNAAGNQTTSGLVRFNQDNASSVAEVLRIHSDGPNAGIIIESGNAAATHIRFIGDPSNGSPVDGDLWFTGSALNFRNGGATVNLLAAGSGDLLADGTIPLTADWNVGAFDITAVEFKGALIGEASTVGTIAGLAPDTATTQATQASITTCANLVTVGTLSAGNATAIVDAASPTAAGKSELATADELNTGTDTGRTITPDVLAGSNFGERAVQMVVFGFETAVATGNGKFYFHVDSRLDGMNLVDVHAEVITASTSGLPTIQIRNVTQTADMLTDRITIDENETGSDTATTPALIDTNNDDVVENDLIAVDVDVAGTNTEGLIITLGWRLP